MSHVIPQILAMDIRGEKWDLKLIPDLTGKVALVTGAGGAGSVGFHIAQQLARNGAKVYIGARSAKKAEAAIDAIVSAAPSVPSRLLKGFIAELSDVKQVKAACDRFLAGESRLDLLIHNAAIVSSKKDLTDHLAPFIITKTLLPLLKATAQRSSSDVRVVTLSSFAHAIIPGPVRFDTKESLNLDSSWSKDQPLLHFAYSKLANILFASQLQKKLDEDGVDIISVSLHPGTVKKVGATHVVPRNEIFFDNALTPLEGSLTPLFAAVAPVVRREKKKYGGAFLMPFGVLSSGDLTENAKNTKLAEELWNTSEEVIAEILNI
ncbi:short-chain dehydrogenase [Cyathus striatus]|nr:short-chain dehydrogenase [Cyathus striatus]